MKNLQSPKKITKNKMETEEEESKGFWSWA